MGDFVSSDPHWGHRLMAERRGFETAAEMDAVIIRNIKRMIRDYDTVWWLGDMAFGGALAALQTIMPQLPGTHRLMLGNHDRPHPLNSRGSVHLRDYLPLFDSISLFERISYNGVGFLMSHFPYSGDHTETDRYSQWRLRDEGKPLLHGHTHSSSKTSVSSNGTPQIHVGMDAWNLKPVPLYDAYSLLREF